MKNTGICRRAFTPAAVLMAMAVSTLGPVRTADNSLAPDASALAMMIDSENPIGSFQLVPGPKIIGSRRYHDYTQVYVETSYKLPFGRHQLQITGRAGKNKEQAMMFYCSGNSGDLSLAAVQFAAPHGYRRPFRLHGGFIEWGDKDYPYVIG